VLGARAWAVRERGAAVRAALLVARLERRPALGAAEEDGAPRVLVGAEDAGAVLVRVGRDEHPDGGEVAQVDGEA